MRLTTALSLAIILAFPSWAFSADATKPADDKIVIIGGKKFFSLQNARHFSGGKVKQPVILKPNKQTAKAGTIISKPHQPLPLTQPADATPGLTKIPPETPLSQSQAPANSNSRASDILSLFAPEDKGTPASPVTAVPATK